MAFKLLAIQGLLLVVCLFGWFSVWNFNIVESIQPFFIRMKEKNEPKRLKNSLFNDKLDYCWFSHVVIKNSHRRIFDAPEFFLSWRIRVAESECSNQFLLRKGSSLFCDHSELSKPLLDAAFLAAERCQEQEGWKSDLYGGRGRDFAMWTVVIY